MKRTWLTLLLLVVVNASLATVLESWFRTWEGNRAVGSGNVLEVALGDGRKLFARHVYAKADAYFHNGYYPSIFDHADGFKNTHLNAEAGLQSSGHAEEGDFLGKPRDWIEAFGRHFYPSVHSHLGEEPCDHEGPCDHKLVHKIGEGGVEEGAGAHDEHENHEGHEDHESPEEHERAMARQKALQREILPWLRLSVELDPQRIETYLVGAYWLRRNLNKPGEAEQFLREGLRANPNNPEILFELGRIQVEVKNDSVLARNLYELALRNWRERPLAARESSALLQVQLLGNLGKLEEQAGRWPQAIGYLQQLKEVSPNRVHIERWIEELQAQHKIP